MNMGSQAPIDVVRRSIAAMNRGDVEAALACCADDVVVWSPGYDLSGQRLEGKKALGRVLQLTEEAWPEMWTNINSIVAGGNTVAVEMTAVAREGGRPISQPMAAFYWVEDGLIVEQRSYYDLGALGRIIDARDVSI
jgi:ketosteroid isomerase-like protein